MTRPPRPALRLALLAVALAAPTPVGAQPPAGDAPDPTEDPAEGDVPPVDAPSEPDAPAGADDAGGAGETGEAEDAADGEVYELTEEDLEMSDEELEAAAAELGLDVDQLDEAPAEDAAASGGPMLREIEVTYTAADLLTVGGSATVVDEAQLQAFQYDDPTDVLLGVPGVYVRPEEGFGLRPNIGIRGVAADRSRKITLMEDGILFGPAPYSAPAAYYFPLMARVVGVEVFKGPSAVRHGPQTVGGSVNFLTREVPAEGGGELDVSYGRFGNRRAHLHYGVMGDRFGLALEGVHLGSDGYKTIDFADDDTGFQRNEATITGLWQSDPERDAYHRVELRLGYSTELSNETYLGLTDGDFRDDPERRYAASQQDRFDWWRTQVRLRHRFELGERFRLVTTAYRHDFDRTWRRLDRFADGTALFDAVTSDSPQYRDQLEVLRGEQDSIPGTGPGALASQLLVVSNGRRFVSQGVQTRAHADFETGAVAHALEVGVRLHHDRVERDQPLRTHLMVGGTLLPVGDAFFGSENEGESLALATHAAWALSFFGLTVTPGVRLEVIGTDFEQRAGDGSTARIERATQVAVLPGLGLTYAITPQLSVLAGLHRGFSPLAPGNVEAVDPATGETRQREPEDSLNYELGVRFADDAAGTLAEVIGFYNDYSSLLGTCAGSSGCAAEEIGEQFNAGEARVFGVEVAAAHTLEVGDVEIPGRLSYTYTSATFQGEPFSSDFPEWGDVEPGDRIPYVPEHQLRAQLGVAWEWLRANVGATYVGRLPEDSDDRLYTDDYLLVDALVGFELVEGLEVYARGENLLNQRPIASRRPFGARPIQPLSVMAGLRVALPSL